MDKCILFASPLAESAERIMAWRRAQPGNPSLRKARESSSKKGLPEGSPVSSIYRTIC